MAPGHCHDAGSCPDQLRRERFASIAGDIDSKIGQNLNRMCARRLPRKRAKPGGTNSNVGTPRNHLAKQSLRHRASTNVPRANKQNIFDSAQSTQRWHAQGGSSSDSIPFASGLRSKRTVPAHFKTQTLRAMVEAALAQYLLDRYGQDRRAPPQI